MNADGRQIVSEIVTELERAWNAGDGERFARPFSEDADFVNIRGEHTSRATLVLVEHQGAWHVAAFHNTLVAQT